MSGISNWNKQLGGQKLIRQGQSSTPKTSPSPTRKQERSTRKTEYFVRTSRTGTKEAFRQRTTIDFK